MQIAILGAGAMGSWFGGRMSVQGHKVQLLTTNLDHIKAIATEGLTLQSHGNDEKNINIRIDAGTPENYAGDADLIIVLTKSYQTAAAMHTIAPALDEKTAVLSLQNGLGNTAAIGEYVKPANIWVGISMMPVDRIAPGVVASRGVGDTSFGHLHDKHHPYAEQIEQAFVGTGISIKHNPDVHSQIWEKVAFNTGMNAVCALTHGTPGTIGQLEEGVSLVRAVAAEVAAVAKAEGVAINLDTVFNMIAYACEYHGEHKASMLQDLLAGKQTEVDALNGAIVRIAEIHGVETPLNALLGNLVRLAELGDHA